MKLLRETIRRLLLETRSDSATDFLVSLQREFDYVRQNRYRTPIFEMKSSSHFKHLLISDFSGVERAKTIWCENGGVNSQSAGWIPSNALITCFGDLAPSEMPEVGDVKLVEMNEYLVTLNQLQHPTAAKFSI